MRPPFWNVGLRQAKKRDKCEATCMNSPPNILPCDSPSVADWKQATHRPIAKFRGAFACFVHRPARPGICREPQYGEKPFLLFVPCPKSSNQTCHRVRHSARATNEYKDPTKYKGDRF